MSENPIFKMNFTEKQFECFNALEFSGLREVLAGGGKGGGKTNLLCKWSYYKIKSLIKFFDLRVSSTPPILGFIGRKRASDFFITTLETWKKEIPFSEYKINELKKIITINNAASILYGGFDDRETVNKFNSMELAFVGIDQVEELDRSEIGSVRGALRLKIKGKQPEYKMLLPCNPPIVDDPNFAWIKDEFIDNPQNDKKFFKFLWKDNPHIATNYQKTLDDAYGFNPDLLAAYRDGEWDRIGAANLVLVRRLVEPLVNWSISFETKNPKRVTVADISEEGGNDETVIYDFVDAMTVRQEIYIHKDLMDTVGRLVAHQKLNRSNFISVDKVGSGAGVYSRLKEIYDNDSYVKVHGFDGRITDFPTQEAKETYANYRAFAYFDAAQKWFKESRCSLPDDRKLIAQLCSMPFKFNSSGKFQILSKEEIKQKYGWSPDRADAYIIGLDALRYASEIIGDNRDDKRSYYVNPHFTAESVIA